MVPFSRINGLEGIAIEKSCMGSKLESIVQRSRRLALKFSNGTQKISASIQKQPILQVRTFLQEQTSALNIIYYLGRGTFSIRPVC